MAQRTKSRHRVHRAAQISFPAQVVRRKVREEAPWAEEAAYPGELTHSAPVTWDGNNPYPRNPGYA